MKSHQELKLNDFYLAIKEKFSIMLNVIIFFYRPVSDKFNNVLERNIDISGIMPFHASRVNFDLCIFKLHEAAALCYRIISP